MTDDLPRRPLFVKLTPPRTANKAVPDPRLKRKRLPPAYVGVDVGIEPATVVFVPRENPHLTAEQRRELDLMEANDQMVARQDAARAKFETDGDKPPRTGRRKKLIVPRYDIAAQVEALGADSLLPPSKLVGVRLSADLIARVDAKRGDAGRQEFIRGILEFALPKLKAVP